MTGGAKGEGIAGTPVYIYNPGTIVTTINTSEGYLDGSLGWGSPGNAGGGATDGAPVGITTQNQYNTGGGGGGNGGSGGKGGSGWHGGTGNVNTYPTGGYGGAAFSERKISQFIMGGGGGAGSANNSTALNQYFSSGASGGGIILMRAGSYAGSGTINANGASAIGLIGSGANTDAGGGGGAGGTIIAVTRTNVPNGLAGISAAAAGGNGGNMETHFDHGPGGGGGGGFIMTNGAFASTNVNGGTNGFTRAGSPTNPVTNSYGAVPGVVGEVITLPSAPILVNAFNVPGACGTLPVTITSFSASPVGTGIRLDWDIEQAIDFSLFEVQYSTDGNNFTTLGLVAFDPNQMAYEFLHTNITQVNYYRLKLVDQSGNFTYSKVLVVRENSVMKDIHLYPQPAKNYVTVQLTAAARQTTRLEIYNSSGSKLKEKQVNLFAGTNNFILDLEENIPAGIYVVRIRVDGRMQASKLVISSKK
jgi:hypothetical protein